MYYKRYGHQPAPRRSPALALILPVIALALAGFTYWRYQTRLPAPHLVIVLDASDSKPINCGREIGGLVDAYFPQVPRAGATITLLVSGEPANDNEPLPLFEGVIPFKPRPVFGGADEETEQARRKLRADLVKSCEGIAEAGRSALRRGVLRAVEHLRALGCDEGAPCEVVLVSDLAENVDPLSGTLAPIPAWPGLRVRFCGYAERVKAGRKTTDIEQLKEDWRGTFSGDVARFAPYCGPLVSAATGKE